MSLPVSSSFIICEGVGLVTVVVAALIVVVVVVMSGVTPIAKENDKELQSILVFVSYSTYVSTMYRTCNSELVSVRIVLILIVKLEI